LTIGKFNVEKVVIIARVRFMLIGTLGLENSDDVVQFQHYQRFWTSVSGTFVDHTLRMERNGPSAIPISFQQS